MNDRKWTQHGNGVASRGTASGRRYQIAYLWAPLTEEHAQACGGRVGKAKKVRETVPLDTDGRARLESAKRFKAKRMQAKRRADFVPPHYAERIEAKQAARETERREPLLFENAVESFMSEEGPTYADGGREAACAFRRLGLFFVGRMLDEVTRLDVREWFTQRASGEGVYSDFSATTRAAETDLSFLRATYTWLADTGHALDNPCHRPKTRRKDSPLAPYHPKREKVIPTAEVLQGIFTATAKAKTGGNGADGRDLLRDKHRAFFMLCYFTAGRPQSEPARLTHGNVTFLADGWAEVTYDETKNEDSRRTLPVPPVVADALRGVMLPEPTRFEQDAHVAWSAAPVFRKRTDGAPVAWDKSSYAKAWAAVRRTVEGTEQMVVRDLRATAATNMRRAGVAEVVVRRFLGHAKRVEDVYQDVNTNDLRAGAEALVAASFPASFSAACHDAT